MQVLIWFLIFACAASFASAAEPASPPLHHAPAATSGQRLQAADEFPAELVRFAPYAHNPVFAAAGPGHWDVKIRERGWIMCDGERWHLWYTGYDGTREGIKLLGHATSADGFSWKRDAANPLDPKQWIEDMMVVRHDGRWIMFAEGRDDQAQWLISADGVHWTRQGTLDIRQTDGRPIPPGPFGTPTAWREEDGTWYLMYERGDRGVWLAKSADLKVWTNVQDEPVLSPGPEEYDREMIAVNQVVRRDGRYFAYYHGSGDRAAPRQWTTNIAVSTDRVHWKKYAANPIVPGNRSSGIVVPLEAGGFRLYTMHDKVEAFVPGK
ncbi:MAG: glycosylase [Planctomycetes bacterium]|nr:glycosylase [Planctomycetota bacterium]